MFKVQFKFKTFNMSTTGIAAICAGGMVSVPVAALISGSLDNKMAFIVCLASIMSALFITFYTIKTLHDRNNPKK